MLSENEVSINSFLHYTLPLFGESDWVGGGGGKKHWEENVPLYWIKPFGGRNMKNDLHLCCCFEIETLQFFWSFLIHLPHIGNTTIQLNVYVCGRSITGCEDFSSSTGSLPSLFI